MDSRIILLETSTSLCSVALLEGNCITAMRVSDTPRAHAALTAPFVEQVLAERGLRVSDCSAVCLSMGPGSYTGLRVGSSTAKGLCFGGGIPLLAVSTLEVLAAQAIEEGLPDGCRYIVPMIDARRMEVYSAVYSADGKQLTEVAPIVVEGIGSIGLPTASLQDEAHFAPVRKGQSHSAGFTPPASCAEVPLAPVRKGQSRSVDFTTSGVLFIGDGVAKCEQLLAGQNRYFRQECPRADAMKSPALRHFAAGDFRDTAYFEPFYLKDFVATVGKRLF